MSDSRIVLFPFGAELVVGELVNDAEIFAVKRPCVLKLALLPAPAGGGMAGHWLAIPMPMRELRFPTDGTEPLFQTAAALEAMYREALAAAAGLFTPRRG